MLREISEIVGLKVRTIDGPAGHVRDIYFDEHSWLVHYLMVDTGLWLSGRQVLIEPDQFGSPDMELGELPVDLTRQQVAAALPKSYDPPVDERRELALAREMGWSAPWEQRPTEAPLLHAAAQEATRLMRQQVDEPEPHGHRSMLEVVGYHLQAEDGEIGHVCDFLVDLASCQVRYLVVDTRNWLPGRKVLISPPWISHISWADRRFRVELARQQVRESPPYRLATLVNRQYERRLREHYGRQDSGEEESG